MIKGVIIFCLGVMIGSWYPDIYSTMLSAFIESGARDTVVETLQSVK